MKHDPIERGIIKVFFPLKGFGFITREKGRELFFHYVDIEEPGRDGVLLEGDHVSFVARLVNGKWRASSVRRAA